MFLYVRVFFFSGGNQVLTDRLKEKCDLLVQARECVCVHVCASVLAFVHVCVARKWMQADRLRERKCLTRPATGS